MSHFYAGIQGARGPATRMGSKDSGIDGYVQSHDARLAVSMNHYSGEDRAHFTLEGGYSNYSGGRLTLNFPEINAVVNAVNQGDPKIQAIVERIQKEITKLNDEAPKALKRIERKRKIEANRQQRQFEEKQARLKALDATITDEERKNFITLVMVLDLADHDELRRWGLHDDERVNESILSGHGNIEPWRDDEGHLHVLAGDGWTHKEFDLTAGVEIVKEVAV